VCIHRFSERAHGWLGMLIEAGGKALLMRADNTGKSCAYIASMNGHAEALKMLIEAGGKKLLMLASKDGVSCVSLLAT